MAEYPSLQPDDVLAVLAYAADIRFCNPSDAPGAVAIRLARQDAHVISYLTSRPSRDLVVAAHQQVTRQWWEQRAARFDLLISELVEQETERGDPDAVQARMAAIANMPILALSDEAIAIAEALVSDGPIPREAAIDALHIAVAAVNGVDYLLTWNCKHLANASLRVRIDALLEMAGYACPVICTPEELMED